MASITWTLIVVAALACGVNSNRIVGGDATTIEQYPSIVQVESRTTIFWSQSCAANIITSQYVISAAHCFYGLFFSISNRRIRAGTSNRGSGGLVYEVESRVNHPTYSYFTSDGDISVIRLATPLVFSNQIQPGIIVSQGFVLPDGLRVVLAGWGTTSQDGPSSSVLRDATIYTINRDLCASRYGASAPVTANMICAGILNVGGKDACEGDFGGPLYYGNILVGIVSWNYGCGDPVFPGVSTNVASYTNWIVSTAV